MSNQIRHQTLHSLIGNRPIIAETMSTQRAIDQAGTFAGGSNRGTHSYRGTNHDLIAEPAGKIPGRQHIDSLGPGNFLDPDAARDVQSRFLSQYLPPIQWLDYYAESRPAANVGGDFFDFTPVESSTLIVSLG